MLEAFGQNNPKSNSLKSKMNKKVKSELEKEVMEASMYFLPVKVIRITRISFAMRNQGLLEFYFIFFKL